MGMEGWRGGRMLVVTNSIGRGNKDSGTGCGIDFKGMDGVGSY